MQIETRKTPTQTRSNLDKAEAREEDRERSRRQSSSSTCELSLLRLAVHLIFALGGTDTDEEAAKIVAPAAELRR